jgi:hypothetical protein
MLNQPKEMNVVNTKSIAMILFFFQSTHMPRFFHLVMPRRAPFEHIKAIKGYVTYYLACYMKLQVQNMPCYLRL